MTKMIININPDYTYTTVNTVTLDPVDIIVCERKIDYIDGHGNVLSVKKYKSNRFLVNKDILIGKLITVPWTQCKNRLDLDNGSIVNTYSTFNHFIKTKKPEGIWKDSYIEDVVICGTYSGYKEVYIIDNHIDLCELNDKWVFANIDTKSSNTFNVNFNGKSYTNTHSIRFILVNYDIDSTIGSLVSKKLGVFRYDLVTFIWSKITCPVRFSKLVCSDHINTKSLMLILSTRLLMDSIEYLNQKGITKVLSAIGNLSTLSINVYSNILCNKVFLDKIETYSLHKSLLLHTTILKSEKILDTILDK